MDLINPLQHPACFNVTIDVSEVATLVLRVSGWRKGSSPLCLGIWGLDVLDKSI